MTPASAWLGGEARRLFRRLGNGGGGLCPSGGGPYPVALLQQLPHLAFEFGHRALHLVHLGAGGDVTGLAPGFGDLALLQAVLRGRAQHAPLRLEKLVRSMHLDQGVVDDLQPSIGQATPGRRAFVLGACKGGRESLESRVPGLLHHGLIAATSLSRWSARCCSSRSLRPWSHRVAYLGPSRTWRSPASKAPGPLRASARDRRIRFKASGVSVPVFSPPLANSVHFSIDACQVSRSSLNCSSSGARTSSPTAPAPVVSGEHRLHQRLLVRRPGIGPGLERVAHGNTTTCRIALPS